MTLVAPLPNAFLTVPFAHRALHDLSQGRPENSVSAIQAAIDHGYGIEIDVQLSFDNQAMVFHDYQLDRLTDEAGPIRAQTASALGEIPLSKSDDVIPDLGQVLSLVKGQVPLLIEIKDQDGELGTNIGALERSVAEHLKTYTGDVAVMSFNPHSVALMAELCPDVARGITTSAYHPEDWPLIPAATRDRLRGIPDLGRVGASFISHEANDLSRPRIGEIKSAGMSVFCWTIRSAKDEQSARVYADNVTFEGYLP